MNKSATILFLMTAAMAPPAVFAGSSSTDWTLGPGGLYSYAGGAGSLIGTDIPVLSVLGDSTLDNNGVTLPVIDGLLNFTSGAGTSGTWSWASGGTLNITGCINSVTTPCNPATNVLVDDDFTSVSLVQVGGFIDAVFGNVTGTLEPSVASYFGVPTAFSTGSFTAEIATTGATGSAFIGTNLLGVIKADPATTTPENWSIGESLGFFALAMITFVALIRRGVLRSNLFQNQNSGRS
jgi:hypothetical protein